MKKIIIYLTPIIFIFLFVLTIEEGFARGGRGGGFGGGGGGAAFRGGGGGEFRGGGNFGGGGNFRGGGGNFRGGGGDFRGGGGAVRRSPSMSPPSRQSVERPRPQIQDRVTSRPQRPSAPDRAISQLPDRSGQRLPQGGQRLPQGGQRLSQGGQRLDSRLPGVDNRMPSGGQRPDRGQLQQFLHMPQGGGLSDLGRIGAGAAAGALGYAGAQQLLGQRPDGDRPGIGDRQPVQTLPEGRPGIGDGPGGDRPGIGDRPGAGDRPSDRPGIGDRPNDRPGIGDRPGAGDRPGIGSRPDDRPGIGDRPGGGDRPGTGDRPGVGDRPNDRPGIGNRPGDRPGIGDRPGDRPGIGSRPGDRPGIGDRPGQRPQWPDGDRIRNNIRDRHGDIFNPRWWRNHPNFARSYWINFGRHPFPYNHWWRHAGWVALGGWVVGTTWSEPIYFDFDNGIYYDNNQVYVNGATSVSADAYYQQASDLALSAPDPTKTESEWLPLGVFALTRPDASDSNVLLQLAVDKQGVIAGTYFNISTENARPVRGMVDKKSQRAAWTFADGKDTDIIMETGIYNLTQDETEALVHFGKDKTEKWLMVRMEERTDSDGSSDQGSQ